MEISFNKKIWVIGISSVIAGAIIGRVIYVNYLEAKEGQENFTPDVMSQITNGDPDILNSKLSDSTSASDSTSVDIQQGYGYSQDVQDSETDPNYYIYE